VSEEDNLPMTMGRPGTYEVWFLTFTDAAAGRGYWIRSTLLHPAKRTGWTEESAGVWFARFDRAEPASTLGLHASVRQAKVAEDRFSVEIGSSAMRSGQATGSVETAGHRASWDLEWATGQPTYRPLPEVMYRGSLAPTKPFSPNPGTRVTGTVVVDGDSVEVRSVPGQQGHLAGTRHAERWAWAQCSNFVGEEAIVYAVAAQGRRGPLVTPFLTSIGVCLQGEWIRLSKVTPWRPFGLGQWKVDLQNRRYRLTGRIEAPARAMLRARYEDPDGTLRFCHNSEIASSRLALFERRAAGFEEVALLESHGTTHAEWSGRTPAAAVSHEFLEASEGDGR
jgi:Tocopherol cyclase